MASYKILPEIKTAAVSMVPDELLVNKKDMQYIVLEGKTEYNEGDTDTLRNNLFPAGLGLITFLPSSLFPCLKHLIPHVSSNRYKT